MKKIVLIFLPLFVLIFGTACFYFFMNTKENMKLQPTEFQIFFEDTEELQHWNYKGKSEIISEGITLESHRFEKNNSSIPETINFIPHTYSSITRHQQIPEEEKQKALENCIQMGGESTQEASIKYSEEEFQGIICIGNIKDYEIYSLLVSILLDERNLVAITMTSSANNYTQNKQDLENILKSLRGEKKQPSPTILISR